MVKQCPSDVAMAVAELLLQSQATICANSTITSFDVRAGVAFLAFHEIAGPCDYICCDISRISSHLRAADTLIIAITNNLVILSPMNTYSLQTHVTPVKLRGCESLIIYSGECIDLTSPESLVQIMSSVKKWCQCGDPRTGGKIWK